jgi:hypothetical protein
MNGTPPHLKTLEVIERECIPGLVRVLKEEGLEAVRYTPTHDVCDTWLEAA